MNVSDIMTPRSELITVELPGTRTDALEHLQGGSISSIPVVKPHDDGEQYRGLLSRERLIERPDEDQLALLMEEVPTIEPEASIETLAAQVLAENARRVPVVDDDGLLRGIVTVTDVIRAIAEGDADGETDVGALAGQTVNTTYAGAPIATAEAELSHADLPYAVVLDDDGEMTGMFTEVDLIDAAEIVEGQEMSGDSFADQDSDWMWEGIKGVGSRALPTSNVEFPDGPVSTIMTEEVVTVSKHKPSKRAAQLLITNGIEQLPLVSGDDLIGIVRDVDLIRALTDGEGGDE